jgi:hypothetical protein
MLYSILGMQINGGWEFSTASPYNFTLRLADGVRLYFSCLRRRPLTETETINDLIEELSAVPIPWLVPGRTLWSLDLDQLAEHIGKDKRAERPNWFRGTIGIKPLFEPGEPSDLANPRKAIWRGFTCFDITEVSVKNPVEPADTPSEIHRSMEAFYADYPQNDSTAFIMMRFGTTAAHQKITQAIQTCLRRFNVIALRADDKEYHSDLFYNILTYIHGCKFGIAVFERIEGDEFNPNVSLEVGYMLALAKPVCLMKDKTLKTMPVDLMGKMYRSFDPQNPIKSIPPVLLKWCQDQKFISA